jgi:hypothetical protein
MSKNRIEIIKAYIVTINGDEISYKEKIDNNRDDKYYDGYIKM